VSDLKVVERVLASVENREDVIDVHVCGLYLVAAEAANETIARDHPTPQ